MKVTKRFALRAGLFAAVFVLGLLGGSHILGFSLSDAVQKVTGTAQKAVGDAKDFASKRVSEVSELAKFGLPTNPVVLVKQAVGGMSDELVSKLLTKVLDIVVNQLSDITKVSRIALQPIEALVSPIPMLPSTDLISDFIMDFVICRMQRETFAYLKVLHDLTKNQYITDKEIEDFKKFEDFEKRSGVIGDNVDLKKARNFSKLISEKIEKFVKPLDKLVKGLEEKGSPLLKPMEAIGREIHPIPFAPLITGGALINRALFICNIKGIEDKFKEISFIMESNLKQVKLDRKGYVTLVDLAKDKNAQGFVTALQKAMKMVNAPMGKLDELIIDPIGNLPWGVKGPLTMVLTVVKLCSKALSSIVKEVVTAALAVVLVETGVGAAAAEIVGKVVGAVINDDFVVEFVAETFYWAWIRLLQRRIDRIQEIIEQAQEDGLSIPGGQVKKLVGELLAFKQNFQGKLNLVDEKKPAKKKEHKKISEHKDKKPISIKPTPKEQPSDTEMLEEESSGAYAA